MLNGVSSQSLINAQAVLQNVATAFQTNPDIKWNPRYRIVTDMKFAAIRELEPLDIDLNVVHYS